MYCENDHLPQLGIIIPNEGSDATFVLHEKTLVTVWGANIDQTVALIKGTWRVREAKDPWTQAPVIDFRRIA